jgi:hypothetical protein
MTAQHRGDKGCDHPTRGPAKKLTPDEVEELSAAYMEECREKDEPLTITGLALALGFASKQSIYDYLKDDDYKYAMGRAHLRVENSYEMQGAKGRGDGFLVFTLKQFGWSDKQEIEHSEKVVDTGENEW